MTKASRQLPDGLHLVSQALKGDRRATARLLTLVENGHPEGQTALAELYPRSGQAHIVGFTGSTGAGKSTLVNEVVREFRLKALEVAVVAVDPTSPFSGGALLGDRLRMRDLTDDPGVFIRSMASRGHPGGIAHATRGVVTVLDALGIPMILVETVGAGQVQVDVARVAHTVVLVEAPGMGDDVQALKAGLMEIADIIVVNKADRPEAHRTVQALRAAQMQILGLGEGDAGWAVPVLETSALEAERDRRAGGGDWPAPCLPRIEWRMGASTLSSGPGRGRDLVAVLPAGVDRWTIGRGASRRRSVDRSTS